MLCFPVSFSVKHIHHHYYIHRPVKAWSPVIALPRISACMSWVPAHKNIKIGKAVRNETSHQEMLVSLKGKKRRERRGGGGRGEGCPNCLRPCENAVDKTSVIPMRKTSSHFPFCQLMYLQCKHLVGVNYNHKLTKVYPNNYVWFEVRVGSWGKGWGRARILISPPLSLFLTVSHPLGTKLFLYPALPYH